MRKESEVGLVSPLPFAAMAFNGAIWTVYGIILREWVPMVLANSIGFVAGSGALITYHQHVLQADKKNLSGALLVALPSALFFLIFVVWEAMIEGSSPLFHELKQETNPLIGEKTAKLEVLRSTLGYLGMCVCLAMFASPLGSVRVVLRSQSTGSMDPTLTAASLACTVAWTTYGFILTEPCIWIPNVCGLFLSLGQAALFVRFGLPPAVAESKGFEPVATELGRHGGTE